MSTIDEIMESVYRSQVAASAYDESSGSGTRELEIDMFAADDEVRSMIADALAEARREGAEAMREAVMLTDEQVAAVVAQHWGRADIAPQSVCGFARSIESAVLAANGLEVRRG